MCGICGIYYPGPNNGRSPDRKVIEAMTHRLRHRGPDGSGVYIDGPLGFGATRLAIIDLSPDASQPMVLEHGDYAITFNGEIYNYLELRNDLEKSGIHFNSASDTEVLLRLYIERGARCLDALRGMFAFAIRDKKKNILFLARDRAGEKPLVYYYRSGMFAFASEIKGLLAVPEIPKEINPPGLYYGLHYLTVPAPFSAFKHIKKLRPAEYMIVSAKGVRTERYWRPNQSRRQMITNQSEAVHDLRRCLSDTVKIMCRSDVPIGATLSGGLDSSGVVSLMDRETAKTIETFCVSYEHTDRDQEFRAARIVANACQTKHHELVFKREHLAAARDAVRSFDEPFGTFVPLHAMALAKLIGSRVKVALTGNGGDELFGGYLDHRILYKLEQRMPFWKLLGKLGFGWLAEHAPLRSLRRSWDKYHKIGIFPKNRLVAELRMHTARSFCENVITNKMRTEITAADPLGLLAEAFDEYGSESIFEGFLYQQLMVGSQHSIVDIPDITGMAHSLEYRSPFLDRDMIELAARIPGRFKVALHKHDAGGKMILREALKTDLPPDIISLHKSGFGSQIPYRKWFLEDWSPYIQSRLASKKLADIELFDTSKLTSLYERARLGEQVPIDMLWGIVMISQWLEEYF